MMNASVPDMRVEADAAGLRPRRWRLGDGEIRHVVAGPLRAVPPHPLLSLAPWLAGRIGRRAVVHHPPVRRPREAPVQVRAGLAGRIGLFARGEVSVGGGKDARIDPRRARRRAIVCEMRRSRRRACAGSARVVAVHLLEELRCAIGLADLCVRADPRARSRTSRFLNPWSRGAWLPAYSFFSRLPS